MASGDRTLLRSTGYFMLNDKQEWEENLDTGVLDKLAQRPTNIMLNDQQELNVTLEAGVVDDLANRPTATSVWTTETEISPLDDLVVTLTEP